ncbi:hypothetical protein Ddye_016482 [Dipteronia dyeriana]|uniref:Uncharacterized protein n=1 Tax=Dipteronia dyeriana TaxID=168575 RepID=A0AAD9X040_9ROSI|nr:hypothetical protein Ddye_016482 [Dipteronia dyeriana]
MGARKLVIHHGGSWVDNCYNGGMTKWVNVRISVSYDSLVKFVQDVVKVDIARYNLQLCSLAFTISGTTHPRIENDNDVSCMMNEDKILPEVFVSVSMKETTDCVQDDNLVQSTFLDQCNLPTSQPMYNGFLSRIGTALGAGVLNTLLGNIPPVKHMRLATISSIPFCLFRSVAIAIEVRGDDERQRRREIRTLRGSDDDRGEQRRRAASDGETGARRQ